MFLLNVYAFFSYCLNYHMNCAIIISRMEVIMKFKKFVLAIGMIGLLLAGCDRTGTSDGSEPDGSETSELTETERFAAAGYATARGWPADSVKNLFIQEGIQSAWVSANVLTPALPQNADLYTRNYVDEIGVDVYKSIEVVRVTADVTTFNRYVDLYNGNENYTVVTSDESNFLIEALEGKVKVGVSFVEESEELPSATYFRFTVLEKEEFIGAPKPSANATRSEITFTNNFKITKTSKELAEWAFSDIFTFSVAIGESAVNVGNIPNNNGVGYLTPQLRVYDKQVLTVEMKQGQIEQVIFHCIDFTEDGVNYVSIDAFPAALENTQRYNTEVALLYHLTVAETTIFSLVVTAKARLHDVTVIYSL